MRYLTAVLIFVFAQGITNCLWSQTTVFYDEFTDNRNHWEDETEETEISRPENGKYYVKVLDGNYHFYYVPVDLDYNRDFAIETQCLILDYPVKKKGAPSVYWFDKYKKRYDGVVGLIWGTNNDMSFNYAFYAPWYKGVGYYTMYKGKGTPIYRKNADDCYYSDNIRGSYKLKVVKSGNRVLFYVNDVLEFNSDYYQPFGKGIGFYVYGEKMAVAFEHLKVTYIGNSVTTPPPSAKENYSSDFKIDKEYLGTCFMLNTNGYLATNYHVVEDVNHVYLEGDNSVYFHADVLVKDTINDIAILKIDDGKYLPANYPQPLSVSQSQVETGTEVFALGYPFVDIMGHELKVTNGIVSAKSGFENDPTLYQVSTSVQPGNSGGPLIDKYGNVLGIVTAKLDNSLAENVTYAVKSTYLVALLQNLSPAVNVNFNLATATKSLPEIIKERRKYVFKVFTMP